MKKIKKISVFLLLMAQILSLSVNVNAHPNHYIYGWVYSGKPKYSHIDSSIFSKLDIQNTDIMYKIKNSYTYKSRMSKISNSTYMQTLMYDYKNLDGGAGRYWSNVTYTDMTPNGSIGYTKWYDSPNGVILDYLSTYIGGNTTPVVPTEIPSYNIKKDIIDWNNIQYSNQYKAYIASTNAEAKLADAKTATSLGRDNQNRNFPIYLNDGQTLDSDVKQELLDKNIRDLYIMGGYARFNFTAGLTDGFNIIRVGGANTQITADYFNNLPENMDRPQHYTPDENGIVIKGDLGSQYGVAYQYLNRLIDTRDVNVLVDLLYTLSKVMNIGKEPSKSDNPSLVLGANIAGFETYWICYYSTKAGEYVYQFVLPGYYEKFEPIPESVTINKVDYQNGNDYWYKPNSEIDITTKGYMDSIANNYPDTMTLLVGNGEYNLRTNSMLTNKAFTDNFKLLGGDSASRSQSNDKNYLNAHHKFLALHDGKTYDVKFTSKLGSYIAPVIDTGKKIKIDGVAPNGDISYDYEDTTLNIDINVKNVVEVGSGVKKFWVEYYSENNPNNIIKEDLKLNSKGEYSISIDLIEKLGDIDGKVNFIVKAEDNVGNIRVFDNYETDTFKVEATIERVLEPHDPVFKGGEKGVLKIKLYGGVDKYKIYFPTKLVELDSTLNKEENITPQNVTEINYEFFIPLGSEDGDYSATVEGYKNNKKKSVQPTFKVQDSITKQLRTRIRLPERK